MTYHLFIYTDLVVDPTITHGVHELSYDFDAPAVQALNELRNGDHDIIEDTPAMVELRK